MSVTAIVLSARPYARRYAGFQVLSVQSEIRSAADLQARRFDSIEQVRTPYFFYLDDDDDVPEHMESVLARCMKTGAPLVYTDEIVVHPSGDEEVTRRRPYSQAAHLADPMLVHHLALCRTADARAALAKLPRGHYCPELLLYWEMAKNGAVYLPVVGYIWNKGAGMHTWPETTLSQMRAALWCKEHP